MQQDVQKKCPACQSSVKELVEAWPAMFLCKACWSGPSWCNHYPPKNSTIIPTKK